MSRIGNLPGADTIRPANDRDGGILRTAFVDCHAPDAALRLANTLRHPGMHLAVDDTGDVFELERHGLSFFLSCHSIANIDSDKRASLQKTNASR